MLASFSKKILGLVLFFFSISCTPSGGGNDALSGLILSPPSITSVVPEIGSPAQNNLNGAFPATQVVISGANFGTDTVVRFNSIQATIISNLGTEIRTSVPDGATPGVMTVSKLGGSCPAGLKTGTNCTGTNFFIDCYAVTNKQYGDEIEIVEGKARSVKFDGVVTKAFRSSVLTVAGNITIGCDSVVTLRVFSPSCVARDLVLQKDPVVAIPAGVSTQFYVTAGSSTCSIGI